MKTSPLSLAILALAGGLGAAAPGVAAPIAGFNGSTLAANDDGSTGAVALGFTLNFFGTNYSTAFVNNNGNITFSSALSTFTPFGLTGPLGQAIIAPFFADVDTRGAGSGVVTYGTGTFAGHDAFGVNYPNVGYYSQRTDKLNNFQLLLVEREDLLAGDFDIYFNYGQMQWETGEASGGTDGLGGDCAVAGFSNGTGNPGTFFELPGSGVCGSLINGGANQLVSATNNNTPGQFLFQIRNGVPEVPVGVPEPMSLALLGAGLIGLAAVRRRQS